MRRDKEIHQELYTARDAARRASIALRRTADALDELGPPPTVRYPAEDEVRTILDRLDDAKARLRDLEQIRLIHSWLAQSARGTGSSALVARPPDAMRTYRATKARPVANLR